MRTSSFPLACALVRSHPLQVHGFSANLEHYFQVPRFLIMSRSRYSTPSMVASMRSPSPDFAPEERDNGWISPNEVEMSASRPASPPAEIQDGEQSTAAVQCQWEKCGQPFYDLQTLIEHIHNGESSSD